MVSSRFDPLELPGGESGLDWSLLDTIRFLGVYSRCEGWLLMPSRCGLMLGWLEG